MVSADSQAFVLSVVDYNSEYNTKLIILAILFLYLIFMIWFSNKLIPFKATRDEVGTYPLYTQMSVKFMRIISMVFLVLFPLMLSIFMYRGYDIDSMVTLLVQGYTVIAAVGFGLFILFGFQWVMDFLATIGVKFEDKRGRIIRRKKEHD